MLSSGGLQARTFKEKCSVSVTLYSSQFLRSRSANVTKLLTDSFKYQSHLMFFDTGHNSVDTVLGSLRGAFSETALKMWAYLRCLSTSKRLTVNLIIGKYFKRKGKGGTKLLGTNCTSTAGTIKKVVDIAFLILTSKWRKKRFEKYACEIRKAQVIA